MLENVTAMFDGILTAPSACGTRCSWSEDTCSDACYKTNCSTVTVVKSIVTSVVKNYSQCMYDESTKLNSSQVFFYMENITSYYNESTTVCDNTSDVTAKSLQDLKVMNIRPMAIMHQVISQDNDIPCSPFAVTVKFMTTAPLFLSCEPKITISGLVGAVPNISTFTATGFDLDSFDYQSGDLKVSVSSTLQPGCLHELKLGLVHCTNVSAGILSSTITVHPDVKAASLAVQEPFNLNGLSSETKPMAVRSLSLV
eukprot:721684-Hanusia_phi.AAC.1